MLKSALKKCVAVFLSAVCVLFPHIVTLSIMYVPHLRRAPKDVAAVDCIHFLKTGSSDAILLESNGHFAMVDAGEDTDNPRGFESLNLKGYEQEVLAYLKAHAADENGKVHLDFVLGTHSHSDHIGGFDTIILDPDVTVDRAYLKVYDSSKINSHEVEEWDNQEVYDQMIDALRQRNVPVIIPDSTPFALGNYTITLFNTVDSENPEPVGENDNSLGVLVEKNGTRVFLSGDIDNHTGDEARLGPEIGQVDLLKVGHHSIQGSTTEAFIEALKPKACVITNRKGGVDSHTVVNIVKICRHNSIYVTGVENGVLAVIGDNGEICYFSRICDWD